jgi:diadenosine tetraphosphate (Ap4A) HIT family hydrolase
MPVSPNAISAVSAARRKSEVNTAVMPSSRRRRPMSAALARPRSQRRPGSHPVAMPRSLSSLNAWVSNTTSIDITRGYRGAPTKSSATIPNYGHQVGDLDRRAPMNLADYEQRVRAGRCFVCAFLDGEPGSEHVLLYDDGAHVAFLNRYPTLPGYALVAPRRHVEDVVGGLTPVEYLAMQSVVHKVARAVAEVSRPERTYLLSLGSMQGNAHVRWHIAPLPPGVPYERQQYHALMAEHGIQRYTQQELDAFGVRIRAALESL